MTTLLEYLKKEAKIVEDYAAAVTISWNHYEAVYARQGWTKEVENAYWFAKNRDGILDNLRKELKSKLDSLYPILKEASQPLSKTPPSKNLPSQKVLKSIESLQGYLKQKPLYTTAQAQQVVEC